MTDNNYTLNVIIVDCENGIKEYKELYNRIRSTVFVEELQNYHESFICSVERLIDNLKDYLGHMYTCKWIKDEKLVCRPNDLKDKLYPTVSETATNVYSTINSLVAIKDEFEYFIGKYPHKIQS